MPKVSQAVHSFLQARRTPANADLIDALCQRCPHLETQVNTIPGTPVEGKDSVFTDGTSEWWNIRIPKNAKTDPVFRDYELTWPLEQYALAIGSTGWDWYKRQSEYVAFDYDSIAGHAKGIGISDVELARVRAATETVPFVQGRRSTRGLGLHLYVWFANPIATQNHDEHAQLAHAVLALIGARVGIDLTKSVDAVGGNTWIWHREATPDGFERLWSATKALNESALGDWRARARAKQSAKVIVNTEAAREAVPLDATHKQTIEKLRSSGYSVSWQDDHNCLHVHTAALAELRENDPSIIGPFATTSEGKDKGTPNAFMYPLSDGGWKVYRFSPGITEHASWEHGEWAHTTFNVPVDLATAAEVVEATAHKKGYVATFDQVGEIARLVGHSFVMPNVAERDIFLAARKDGCIDAKLVVSRKDDDDLVIPGWVRTRNDWEAVIGKPAKPKTAESLSDRIRKLVAENGDSIGWCMRDIHDFANVTKDDVICRLMDDAKGSMTKDAARAFTAKFTHYSYRIVDEPFGPEYPKPYHWNRYGAQLKYEPKQGPHKHFDLILQHIGRQLDDVVRWNGWCAARGITTGYQYLLTWCASFVQRPWQKLPMLFLYGEQNSGKSALGAMLTMLFTRGARNIDLVFTRSGPFNGELAGTLLGLIEEADLSGTHAVSAYNKLKMLTTSKSIAVEMKNLNAFEQRNAIHIIQTGNHKHCCPILERDDSRIVVIEVPLLSDPIADTVMSELLESEAPAFTHTITTLKLPEPSEEDDRLFLPPLFTPAKAKVIESVAYILKAPVNEQAAAVTAHGIEDRVRFMAAAGWLIKVTASQVLGWLRWFGHKGLPDTATEMGTVLKRLDTSDLVTDSGRSGRSRWITIATPQAMANHEWAISLDDLDETSADVLAAYEHRLSELPPVKRKVKQ